ncbi:glycoside hydrolase family 18 protein [Sphaerobolus stellatus SS14]|uniref:Glycoside hydrolase family 18 protein n=1 Tax=Sphaerobolus stellatus (strain SS14) TaxID=990650 RepID=A0A0C9U782_SPHS4|nr:glycoside hydrolase family 18 protein [Sphaerobolus stellatus SS14]
MKKKIDTFFTKLGPCRFAPRFSFLTFLQELHANPPTSKPILSATAHIHPWNDAMGSPSQNVTALAELLDFVEIEDRAIYKIWDLTVVFESFQNNGSDIPWIKPTGPNSPLDDSCTDPQFQKGSATSAVKLWTAAGMSVDRLVSLRPGELRLRLCLQ